MAKKSVENKETEIDSNDIKKMLEERIARGDFRIVKGFKFKDSGKELEVDYKEVDKNYFLEDNPMIEHFKEKYSHQKFIILE